jgi:hypothetical protein
MGRNRGYGILNAIPRLPYTYDGTQMRVVPILEDLPRALVARPASQARDQAPHRRRLHPLSPRLLRGGIAVGDPHAEDEARAKAAVSS